MCDASVASSFKGLFRQRPPQSPLHSQKCIRACGCGMALSPQI